MSLVCSWQNHSDLWSLAGPHRMVVRACVVVTKMHTVCKMFCVIATDTSGTCQVYRWSFAASVCWPGCVLLETPLNHAKRWNKAEIGFYTSCSDISQRLPQKFSKVAHFTKKLLESCFLSTQKNQFLLLMKVNLCTSIRIIYLFIYSFLLADISIPTEMIF